MPSDISVTAGGRPDGRPPFWRFYLGVTRPFQRLAFGGPPLLAVTGAVVDLAALAPAGLPQTWNQASFSSLDPAL